MTHFKTKPKYEDNMSIKKQSAFWSGFTALFFACSLAVSTVGCSVDSAGTKTFLGVTIGQAEAVVSNSGTIINALSATGILGKKGTADASAAGWALQTLVNKQNGTKITAADLTTGIAKVDAVIRANVSPGKLTSSGADKLLTVAESLIGSNAP